MKFAIVRKNFGGLRQGLIGSMMVKGILDFFMSPPLDAGRPIKLLVWGTMWRNWKTEPRKIQNHILNYFQSIFTTYSKVSYLLWGEFDNFQWSSSALQKLISIPLELEIITALNSINKGFWSGWPSCCPFQIPTEICGHFYC